jgi:hypothetical protein
VTDDSPTPRTSGSYALFRDEARRVAQRLSEISFTLYKRIDLYDAEKIARVDVIADRLRVLADIFAGWPTATPEQVAMERTLYVPEFGALFVEAIAIIEHFPSHGTLGRVGRLPPR